MDFGRAPRSPYEETARALAPDHGFDHAAISGHDFSPHSHGVIFQLKHEIYASRDRGGRTNPNHCKARGVQSAVRRKTAVPKSAAAVLSSSLTPPSSPPHVDEKVTPQSVSAQGVCVAKP